MISNARAPEKASSKAFAMKRKKAIANYRFFTRFPFSFLFVFHFIVIVLFRRSTSLSHHLYDRACAFTNKQSSHATHN